jgi:hypothetical protein
LRTRSGRDILTIGACEYCVCVWSVPDAGCAVLGWSCSCGCGGVVGCGVCSVLLRLWH